MDKNIKNTIQNKQATTEFGRSMVEMLGVLAVIGVLSIGSIWGLQRMFASLEASDIRVSVTQMVLDASVQRFKKQIIF